MPPSETPPTTAWSMPRWSRRAMTWSGVGVHPVERGPQRAGRQPVPGQVEEDDPVALGRQVRGQSAVHVGVHEDAVEEDQDPGAAAVDLVVQLEVVVDELADLVGGGRARVVVRAGPPGRAGPALGFERAPSRRGAPVVPMQSNVGPGLPVRQHRQAGAHVGRGGRSRGRRATMPGVGSVPFGQHRAPRIDDHRVAVAAGHARRELADLAGADRRRPGPRRPGPAAGAPSGPGPVVAVKAAGTVTTVAPARASIR